MPKSSLPYYRVMSMLCALFAALRILNTAISQSPLAKLTLSSTFLTNSSTLVEKKVQHRTSPHWLLYHLEKEVVTNIVQENSELCMPCCATPLSLTGQWKSPMRELVKTKLLLLILEILSEILKILVHQKSIYELYYGARFEYLYFRDKILTLLSKQIYLVYLFCINPFYHFLFSSCL